MTSKSEVIELFEGDRRLAMKIVDTGASITSFLGRATRLCPLIGSTIKEVRFLGEGNFGAAFEIDFPGRGTRRYAIKISEPKTDTYHRFGLYRLTYRELSDKYGISLPIIFGMNPTSPRPNSEDDPITSSLVIPLFMRSCRLPRSLVVNRVDNGKPLSLDPSFSLVCGEGGSEFAISVLVSKSFVDGTSIHFLDVFDFATCNNEEDFPDPEDLDPDRDAQPLDANETMRQYTFVQMASTTLEKLHRKSMLPPGEMDAIVLQVLHSIHVYQERWNIVHGDLHADNVFLERIEPDLTWQGKRSVDWKGAGSMAKAIVRKRMNKSVDTSQYFAYVVDGHRMLYLKRGMCPYIVKLGDWGMSCKYATPQILEMDVTLNGADSKDGSGPIVPNFYTALYDPLMFINHIVSLGYRSKFIDAIVGSILDAAGVANLENLMNPKLPGRPNVKIITKTVPLREWNVKENILLREDIMHQFMLEPPRGSKVVILGDL